MPQLDTTTFSSQLFWLGFSFLFLFFIIYFTLPKIAAILENRDAFQEQKINQASDDREQAENLLIEYEKLLSQARRKAQQQYHNLVHQINQEIAEKKKDMVDRTQERLHLAEQNLYRARVKASLDINDVAQEVARDILQKLTKHSFTSEQLLLRDKNNVFDA